MSTRHSKIGKGRKDAYYRLAKEQGYRSRAAFKLEQIDERFGFLAGTQCLIDLCAAPGGWSQVAARRMPVGSLIVAVDLVPIRPIPGVVSFQADITTPACRATLRERCAGWEIGAVVHDGAPNMGTDWSLDAFLQNGLVLAAAKLACEFLTRGGIFVTKVFRSSDYLALLHVLEQLFRKVDAFKPRASRDSSAEIFLVCRDYLSPKELDQRFFDPAHVFRDYTREATENAREEVFAAGTKAGFKQESSLRKLVKYLDSDTRHRDGYDEDGGAGLRRSLPVLDFVVGDAPVNMLARHVSIDFTKDVRGNPRFSPYADPSKLPDLTFNGRRIDSWEEYARLHAEIVAHPKTTENIVAVCNDILAMNKGEFRRLLVWRECLLAYLCTITIPLELEATNKAKEGEELQPMAPNMSSAEFLKLPPEQQAVLQAQFLLHERQEKERRDAKYAARKLERERRKQMKKGTHQLGMEDAILQRNLFSLSQYEKLQEQISEKNATTMADVRKLGEQLHDTSGHTSPSNSDSDELGLDERERYLDEIDRNADYWYDELAQKREKLKTKLAERETLFRKSKGYIFEDDLIVSAQNTNEADGLATKRLQDRWFGQAAFLEDKPTYDREKKPSNEPEMDKDDEYWDSYPLPRDILQRVAAHKRRVKEIARQEKKKARREAQLAALKESVDNVGTFESALHARSNTIEIVHEPEASSHTKGSETEDSSGDDSSPMVDGSLKKLTTMLTTEDIRLGYTQDRVDMGSNGALSMSSDSHVSSSSDEEVFEEDLMNKEEARLLKDPHNQAIKLALVKKAGTKKGRDELLDSTINRYAFFHDEDPGSLPRWFVNDEETHWRPAPPVTKDEIALQKARIEALSARPIKKVREAMARKRLRAYSRLKMLTTKADALTARTDLSEREKVTILEKAAARVRKAGQERKRTRIVVSNINKRGALDNAGRRDKRGVKHVDRRMKKDLLRGHPFIGGVGKKAMRSKGLVNQALAQFKQQKRRRR
ncbi:putative FtsJ cell division protein [Giardia muris]|uniref:Putative FtsJ cell division protein n=1 Tax=Giardia muris TaxID=5742 RepID=A0A4Z1SNC4_GIAMU|nr:putative FtsJ cell division protein [Giardia muris]|eukprot:TNJ27264.1 putative FtsJ cell division protein [Giardia muris]